MLNYESAPPHPSPLPAKHNPCPNAQKPLPPTVSGIGTGNGYGSPCSGSRDSPGHTRSTTPEGWAPHHKTIIPAPLLLYCSFHALNHFSPAWGFNVLGMYHTDAFLSEVQSTPQRSHPIRGNWDMCYTCTICRIHPPKNLHYNSITIPCAMQ